MQGRQVAVRLCQTLPIPCGYLVPQIELVYVVLRRNVLRVCILIGVYARLEHIRQRDLEQFFGPADQPEPPGQRDPGVAVRVRRAGNQADGRLKQ